MSKAEAVRLWRRGILSTADVEREMLTPERRLEWDAARLAGWYRQHGVRREGQ